LFQRDVHARHGGSLALAERAEESLDRLLLVVRMLFQFLNDLVAPSGQMENCPLITLGSHVISQRQLPPGASPGPGAPILYLQEMSFYDGEQVEPYCRRPEGLERAVFDLHIYPQAKVKGKKFSRHTSIRVSLMGREGGGSSQGRIHFRRHNETYFFSLPDLWIDNPLGIGGSSSADGTNPSLISSSSSSPLHHHHKDSSTTLSELNYLGTMVVSCPANGLECTLEFKPHALVKGEVTRLESSSTNANGSGRSLLCQLNGAWDSSVQASSRRLDASGLVYSSNTSGQGGAGGDSTRRVIDLRRFGPRMLPRFWIVIHDALYSMSTGTDRSDTAAARLMVEAVRREISDLSVRSQAGLTQPVSGRIGSTAPATMASASDTSDTSDSSDEDDELGQAKPPVSVVQVPPCVWSYKKQGRKMWYRLQYRLIVVPSSHPPRPSDAPHGLPHPGDTRGNAATTSTTTLPTKANNVDDNTHVYRLVPFVDVDKEDTSTADQT